MPIVQAPRTPPGAVLVRVRPRGRSWVGQLPPVPAGATVTVTVTDDALAHVPADDLVSAGYRIAGVVAGATATPAVDLLVPGTLITAAPAWFRGLLDAAERAFDCDLGPVQALLGPELRLHERAIAEHPGR